MYKPKKKKNHLIVLFKTVNFVTCELYVNKKTKQKQEQKKLCERSVGDMEGFMERQT